MVNIKNKFFFLSVAIALLLWILETLIHSFIFQTGGFREELFPIHHPHEIWMRTVITVIALLAGLISQKMANKLFDAYEKEKQINKLLEESFKEIKVLKEILPICSSCKKIRDDEGYWNNLEKYISDHSNTKFTHGLCPECAVRLYPQFSKNSQSRSTTPK